MKPGWQEQFSIGHPDLDQEHQTLIEVMAVLSASYCDRDLVDTQIKILERYIKEHFSREEMLMRQADYPALDAHRLMHEAFRAKVHDMRDAWSKNETPELHKQIAEELSDWFMGHIQTADQAYVPWVMKNIKA